jgi:hypothetical protein
MKKYILLADEEELEEIEEDYSDDDLGLDEEESFNDEDFDFEDDEEPEEDEGELVE